MHLVFPQPLHMPCPACGQSVARGETDEHVCNEGRWLDYQVFQRRHELEAFEAQLATYLDTPRGRFDLWYAQRRRAA